MLCGNKLDLPREVQEQEGKELADKENLLFFETSAKTCENINKMFYTCISELPFFTQLEIDDKNALVNDLENTNKNKEQNSIYDIVRNNNNGIINNNNNNPPPGLTINGVHHSQDNTNKNKKKCAC